MTVDSRRMLADLTNFPAFILVLFVKFEIIKLMSFISEYCIIVFLI